MKQLIVAAAIAVAMLGGCKNPLPAPRADALNHRYAGIGIYGPGPLWSKVAVADKSASPAAAKISDDDEIIVVVDSNTGEIRQCGNLSGYCVGMNPWTKGLTAAQIAPINLADHRTAGSSLFHPTPASASDAAAAASDAAAAASTAPSR